MTNIYLPIFWAALTLGFSLLVSMVAIGMAATDMTSFLERQGRAG